MRILQISTAFERTPPIKYGGIERVVSLLADALVARGHDVTLFATSDSQTSAKLQSFYPSSMRPYHWATNFMHQNAAFRLSSHFDIVHNHLVDGLRYEGVVSTPIVTTIHSAADASTKSIVESFGASCLVFLSKAHRRNFEARDAHFIAPNAVDTELLTLGKSKSDFYLFMGNICRRKGAHSAVQFCRAMGERLILAGPVRAESQSYFEQEIRRNLDPEKIVYVGEVGGQYRLDLLRSAKAVLSPVEYEEPFGLVLAEANACGTPVIAYRRGAIPEVVCHGVTGFVVDDFRGMVEASAVIEGIDPVKCRAWAVKHFSVRAMVDRYLLIYEDILKANPIARSSL